MDVLDVLAPTKPRWTDHLAHLYEPTIVHVPWLWSAIYAATNSPLCPLIYHALAGQSLVRRVMAAAEAQPPDVVVSVHPLMVRAAVAARAGWRAPQSWGSRGTAAPKNASSGGRQSSPRAIAAAQRTAVTMRW